MTLREPDLFSQPSEGTGYSWKTSLPAFHENKKGKAIQVEVVYSFVLQLKQTTIKQLHELTELPDATVSARINNLIDTGRVKYECDEIGTVHLMFYKGRNRKKIVLT